MKTSIALVAGLTMAALSTQAGAGTAWPRYTDAQLGWSMSYPAGWKVNPRYVSVSLGPDHEIHGVSFDIPDSVQPGTNVSHNDTGVSVESIPGKACKPSQFVNPAQNVRKLKADGRVYSAAESGDAAMGNRYDTDLFVIEGTSPCIAVRYFIHTTVFENYEPGSIKRFNRASLIATFNRMRATLTLKP